MTRALLTSLGAALCAALAPLASAQAAPARPPAPAGMIFIGRGAGGSADTYFLANTFQQVDSRTRSAQIVLSYDKPRLGLTADYQDDPNQRFMSYKSTWYVRCAEGTTASAYDTQLSEPLGAGVVVGKILGAAPPKDAWYLMPTVLYDAYPIETTIIRTICEYKPR